MNTSRASVAIVVATAEAVIAAIVARDRKVSRRWQQALPSCLLKLLRSPKVHPPKRVLIAALAVSAPNVVSARSVVNGRNAVREQIAPIVPNAASARSEAIDPIEVRAPNSAESSDRRGLRCVSEDRKRPTTHSREPAQWRQTWVSLW